jgi:hypothetical protein
MLPSLFYLTTALHVSGVTITCLQEHKTTVTTVFGNGYTVWLSVVIVEELELHRTVVCCYRGRVGTTPSGCLLLSWNGWNYNSSTIATDNSTV